MEVRGQSPVAVWQLSGSSCPFVPLSPWRASGRLAFGLAAGKVAEAAVADLTAESTSHPHSAWLWISFDRQAAVPGCRDGRLSHHLASLLSPAGRHPHLWSVCPWTATLPALSGHAQGLPQRGMMLLICVLGSKAPSTPSPHGFLCSRGLPAAQGRGQVLSGSKALGQSPVCADLRLPQAREPRG